MKALMVVRVIGVVCRGLIAGILLGHRAGVSVAMPRLPASCFVQLQQIIHAVFVWMMPILIVSAALSSIAWTILLRRQRSAAPFWLVLAATVGVLATFAMTRAVNVPINEQLMTWNVQAPPANLMELWGPWEQVHSVRTVLMIAAFGCEVVALSAAAPTAQGRNEAA